MLKLAAKRILFANFCLVVMLAIATSLRQRVFLQSQSKLITKCLSTAVQPAAIQKVPREPPAWIDVSDNEFLKLGLNDQLMQAVAAQGNCICAIVLISFNNYICRLQETNTCTSYRDSKIIEP